MARKNQDEYVDVYYGIDIDTCEVKPVWVTRGGNMACGTHTHQIMPGRDVRSELIIVFNLSNQIRFHPSSLQEEYAKRQIEELKGRAEEMKKNKADDSNAS
ncbi:MAG: hypothetical protein LRY36_00320 [Alphaproteobacteria bacterium]|nr:hypothetical protein [Alphaproteobacteria bacterium]